MVEVVQIIPEKRISERVIGASGDATPSTDRPDGSEDSEGSTSAGP